MPALAVAFVVYAGVAGTGGAGVDGQLRALLHELEVAPVAVTVGERRTLARGGAEARALVRRRATDGLVVAEVLHNAPHGAVLRVLVFDGTGRRLDLLELGLEGALLPDGDLDTLRSNLRADFPALPRLSPAPAPAPEEPPTPTEVAVPAPPSPVAVVETHEAPGARPLRVRVTIGAGVLARSFSPGPPALVGYEAGAVPAVALVVDIEPTGPIRLSARFEHSVGMTTRLAGTDVPTAVGRWEAVAAWRLGTGRLEVAPFAGVGQRAFSVASKDPTRSPDGGYNYLVAGLELAGTIGAVTLAASAAFEPAVGGDEPTAATFGPARRLGLDAALDVRVALVGGLFVAAEARAQRFWWSFSGARVAGGASDTYPVADLRLGYRY